MVALYADTPSAYRTFGEKIWLLLNGFGHISVTIFFVLSGYLVGGRLLERARHTGSIEWKRYIIDRVVRIHLVLIPALVLTFFVDKMLAHYDPTFIQRHFPRNTSWTIFAGNIFNLQNFYVPFFGSDGPIGTLANEFWYYFTFPLLLAPLLITRPRRERVFLFVLGLVLCLVFWWPQHQHIWGFLIWGVGVMVAWLNRPLLRSVPFSVCIFLIVAVLLRAIVRREVMQISWYLFVSDVILSIAFANLMLALRFATDPERTFLYSPLHSKLAGFSYSLYACHMPLLFLACLFCKAHFGFGMGDVVTHSSQWLIVAGALSAILACAYLISVMTENHTKAVRHCAYRLLKVERVTRPDGPGEASFPKHPALGQEPG
jgi:peptidoglycan/LPS O-acetylase OafA/YrhL